jgi:hypothetical protein
MLCRARTAKRHAQKALWFRSSNASQDEIARLMLSSGQEGGQNAKNEILKKVQIQYNIRIQF